MSAAVAAALTNRCTTTITETDTNYIADNHRVSPPPPPPPPLSRYESQKRRDWNTFGQYLKNHRPPLALARCSGAHVLEFLRYLDQFGKTKVHTNNCPFFGHPHPPAPCPCPLKQAWGSLDALVGRLRAAFEEHGGSPETNPFGARAVRLYLREVRDSQAKARGIAYEKKKRKKPHPQQQQPDDHDLDHDHQSNGHEMIGQQGYNGQVCDGAFDGLGMAGSSDHSRSSMFHMSIFN